MDTKIFDRIVSRAKKFLDGDRISRMTPSDMECEELRTTMRGQFMKLKEKGLSIRVVSF